MYWGLQRGEHGGRYITFAVSTSPTQRRVAPPWRPEICSDPEELVPTEPGTECGWFLPSARDNRRGQGRVADAASEPIYPPTHQWQTSGRGTPKYYWTMPPAPSPSAYVNPNPRAKMRLRPELALGLKAGPLGPVLHMLRHLSTTPAAAAHPRPRRGPRGWNSGQERRELTPPLTRPVTRGERCRTEARGRDLLT